MGPGPPAPATAPKLGVRMGEGTGARVRIGLSNCEGNGERGNLNLIAEERP